jgi:hypothetical protein
LGSDAATAILESDGITKDNFDDWTPTWGGYYALTNKGGYLDGRNVFDTGSIRALELAEELLKDDASSGLEQYLSFGGKVKLESLKNSVPGTWKALE